VKIPVELFVTVTKLLYSFVNLKLTVMLMSFYFENSYGNTINLQSYLIFKVHQKFLYVGLQAVDRNVNVAVQ